MGEREKGGVWWGERPKGVVGSGSKGWRGVTKLSSGIVVSKKR